MTVPDASWTKAEIRAWLASAGVVIDDKAASTLSKAELLDLVADVLSTDGDQ